MWTVSFQTIAVDLLLFIIKPKTFV